MASRYMLIRGSFPVVGTEPDGDTVRFKPDDPTLVSRLGPAGIRPKFSAGGTQISVRFEAIDALETHFSGVRQQVALGDAATARMLALAGFTSVQTTGTKVTAAAPPEARGHVVANSLDSYGRVIGFVFAGEATGADGGAVFLTAPILDTSVNTRLLVEGVAYPAFYTTLPTDLKNHLATVARGVRAQGLGVWAEDAPSLDRAAEVPDLRAAEALVMWPKLFRRLVSYFQGGNAGLAGFDAWLRKDPRNRDDLLQLPTGELGNMHDLVQISGTTIRLRYRPEDLVVLPDTIVVDPQPQPQPHPGPTPEPTPEPTPGPTPEPTPGPTPAPAPHPGGTVRVVAALANPAGIDTGHETVTLLNTTAAAVDLAGWQVRDRQLQASGGRGVALSGSIGAGEALRVALRAPVQLGNSGDDIVLVDAGGHEIDRATFTAGQALTGRTVVF